MEKRVERVKEVAEVVRADSRKISALRWGKVSEFLRDISEPASSKLRVLHDELDDAIHSAQASIGALQNEIASSEQDFNDAHKDARKAVEKCVRLFKQLGGE